MNLNGQHRLLSSYSGPVENPYSPSVLGKKFIRLRLRPSPPTPGERNLRLHWQKNSAFCNSLARSPRKAVSAPPTTRLPSRCMNIRNSKLRINVQDSELKYLQKREEIFPLEKREKNIQLNNFNYITSTRKKLPSPSQQLRNCFGRSPSFTGCIRPSTTPGENFRNDFSRYSEDKKLKPITKYRNDLKLNFLSNQSFAESKSKLESETFERDIFESDTNKTGELGALNDDVSLNKALNKDRNIRKQIKPDSVVPINLSKQLMNLKRSSDVAGAKHNLIRIRSLQKKVETKPKTSDEPEENKIYPATPIPRSSAICENTNPFNIIRQRQKDLRVKTDPPKLEIKHINTSFVKDFSQPPYHEQSIPTSSNVCQPYLCSKNQLRIKKISRRENNQERKTELCRKQEKTSIFVEKELIVPNPSLDDFGKRSGYQSADEDIRINNLYENDQDPAVMLRILSWLKQVENNSDFFYGFDEN